MTIYQNFKFAHTLYKCKKLRSARKIIEKTLFIRNIRFHDVFSYPVMFFKKNFLNRHKLY